MFIKRLLLAFGTMLECLDDIESWTKIMLILRNSEMSLLMTFKVDSDGDERLDP